MSSPRVGNPRVGVSTSCPVTFYMTHLFMATQPHTFFIHHRTPGGTGVAPFCRLSEEQCVLLKLRSVIRTNMLTLNWQINIRLDSKSGTNYLEIGVIYMLEDQRRRPRLQTTWGQWTVYWTISTVQLFNIHTSTRFLSCRLQLLSAGLWVPDLLDSHFILFSAFCLQCFDTVGWAAGRASSL